MLLQSIKYLRLKSKSREWGIEGRDGNPVQFNNFNLLVGKNSAGKSQTLGVIREISGLISGHLKLSEIRYLSAIYELTFTKEGDIYKYFIQYENRLVVNETLSRNGELIMDREKGEIYNEKTNEFQPLIVDKTELAISVHTISEYPFLEKLYLWGNTLKNAAFSNQFEKNYLIDDLSKLDVDSPLELKEPSFLLYSFLKGKEMFGDDFVNRIIANMQELGYDIDSVGIHKQNGNGYGMFIQEKGVDFTTDQLEMSQGMYRALSFLVHLNFALLNKISVCILIDDLGEGLDFNRSNLLIDMLIKGIDQTGIQIFVSTNDRYIMNKFPLKYWSVIERHPKRSVFFNYFNSKEIFDDFKYTGLNNFDFLATDFYLRGFGDAQEKE